MKRAIPFGEQVDISSDDSDTDDIKPDLDRLLNIKFIDEQPLKELSEGILVLCFVIICILHYAQSAYNFKEVLWLLVIVHSFAA